MRTQTFGVELEMMGITRKTVSEYISGSYDKYAAKDSTGRLWYFVSDSSIRVERGRNGEGQQVEMVTPREDSRVPVVLWEISDRDERNLDRYEGFPRLYFKKDFRVYLGKRKVSAFAYIMSSGYAIGISSEYYYNVILRATPITE